jgi:hypothetical protein
MTPVDASPSNTSAKWNQMSAQQKAVFVGKLVVFLCTLGFVFPGLLQE